MCQMATSGAKFGEIWLGEVGRIGPAANKWLRYPAASSSRDRLRSRRAFRPANAGLLGQLKAWHTLTTYARLLATLIEGNVLSSSHQGSR
jgi:hypothetical protein